MPQCPISERLHYLTYIGALISLPVEEMSHAAREQCHCALWKKLFVSFLHFYFHAKITAPHNLLFLALCLPPSLRPISLCPFASFLCVSPSGEPEPECRRYVQVRNITKGDCRLDNVEVSFCRGRCLSRTDVILEVRSIHTHRR